MVSSEVVVLGLFGAVPQDGAPQPPLHVESATVSAWCAPRIKHSNVQGCSQGHPKFSNSWTGMPRVRSIRTTGSPGASSVLVPKILRQDPCTFVKSLPQSQIFIVGSVNRKKSAQTQKTLNIFENTGNPGEGGKDDILGKYRRVRNVLHVLSLLSCPSGPLIVDQCVLFQGVSRQP